MLALIAKVNRKPVPSGRLVTAEEKDIILRKQNQSPLLLSESERNGDNSYGALQSIEISDFFIVSSDNESDSEFFLEEHTDRRTWIKNQLVDYYHWILILFKNGWWRTTLLLWFIW